MLTKLTVVIISEYIHISNHYVVHLKFIQCICLLSLSKTGETKKRNHIMTVCRLSCMQGITSNLVIAKSLKR